MQIPLSWCHDVSPWVRYKTFAWAYPLLVVKGSCKHVDIQGSTFRKPGRTARWWANGMVFITGLKGGENTEHKKRFFLKKKPRKEARTEATFCFFSGFHVCGVVELLLLGNMDVEMMTCPWGPAGRARHAIFHTAVDTQLFPWLCWESLLRAAMFCFHFAFLFDITVWWHNRNPQFFRRGAHSSLVPAGAAVS